MTINISNSQACRSNICNVSVLCIVQDLLYCMLLFIDQPKSTVTSAGCPARDVSEEQLFILRMGSYSTRNATEENDRWRAGLSMYRHEALVLLFDAFKATEPTECIKQVRRVGYVLSKEGLHVMRYNTLVLSFLSGMYWTGAVPGVGAVMVEWNSRLEAQWTASAHARRTTRIARVAGVFRFFFPAPSSPQGEGRVQGRWGDASEWLLDTSLNLSLCPDYRVPFDVQ
jgi:hypothetical protein